MSTRLLLSTTIAHATILLPKSPSVKRGTHLGGCSGMDMVTSIECTWCDASSTVEGVFPAMDDVVGQHAGILRC